MAKVIQGTFPRANKEQPGDEKKPAPTYQFTISLTYSDPPIWRRFQVPGDFSLLQMHEVIMLLMGWSGVEAHQFYVGKIFYEMVHEHGSKGEEKRFDESKYSLHDVEEGMKWCFLYLYDAGEGWEHELELEEILPFSEEKSYPHLLAGERGGPPEDFDGIHEYEHYLTGLAEPDFGGSSSAAEGMKDFDPYLLDIEQVNMKLRDHFSGK